MQGQPVPADMEVVRDRYLFLDSTKSDWTVRYEIVVTSDDMLLDTGRSYWSEVAPELRRDSKFIPTVMSVC